MNSLGEPARGIGLFARGLRHAIFTAGGAGAIARQDKASNVSRRTMSDTFQIRFCRRFGLPAEAYGAVVLSGVLYPHARVLRLGLLLLDRHFFDADREFVRAVGRLVRRDEFEFEAQDFRHHPDNLRFARRVLRLRASTARMARLFHRAWTQAGDSPAPPAASGSPFAAKDDLSVAD